MAICPTVVFPLISSNKSVNIVHNSISDPSIYSVRTLLDDGSSVNWIAPTILKYVKHQILNNILLTVQTFSGQSKQRYKLVEVYTTNPTLNSLRCFVMHEYSEAQMFPNLSSQLHEYFMKHNLSMDILNNWIDPYDSANVNHDLPACMTNSKTDSHSDSQTIEPLKSMTFCGLIVSSYVINKIKSNFNEKIAVCDLTLGLDLSLELTTFGYVISGLAPKDNNLNFNTLVTVDVPVIISNNENDNVSEYLFAADHKLKYDLGILWDKETLGVYDHELHINDEAALTCFKDSVQKDPTTGQYEVGLPFNDRKWFITDNFRMAYARARSEQRKMIEDEIYLTLFLDQFNTLQINNYIEQVDMLEEVPGPITYLPYRGIRKDNSTTKLRIVMDASAKSSINHVSLNDALYTGPNKVADLAQCLINFTIGSYACVSDIRQAFLRIWIKLSDRDVQRFLVPENLKDINSKMLCYRYTSVMFGTVASPFLLAAVLEKHILDFKTKEFVKNALMENKYVDNISFASDNPENLLLFYKESNKLMKEGGFELRQWASNNNELMSLANYDNIADNNEKVKVLGLLWNTTNDSLKINPEIKWNGKFTKRSVLAATNSIFDPLCYLGPIEIQNRLFLQKLWQNSFKWDEPFDSNNNLKENWITLYEKSYNAVKLFSIKRNVVFNQNTNVHVFSDASSVAYGVVIYLSNPPCDEFPNGTSNLVLSKGKVKSLKGSPKGDKADTIPKLELMAMLLGARMYNFLGNILKFTKSNNVYLWSDARVVLDWLNSPEINSTFVHRRVVDIRNLCANAHIRHVSSSFNPADIITRNVSAVEKFMENELWWHGPPWLTLPITQWPKEEFVYNLNPKFKESPIVNINCAIINSIESCVPEVSVETPLKSREVDSSFFNKYFSESNFNKGLLSISFILHILYLKTKGKFPSDFKESNLSFFNYAKVQCIKLMQRQHFKFELELLKAGKEITSGPCKDYGLTVDELGILRCGGYRHRLLDPVHPLGPILVAPFSPFVQSYIKHLHFHSNCCSKNYTLNKVKREMHGPNIRDVTFKIVRDCYTCKVARSEALKFGYPASTGLPHYRWQFIAAFASCGVDLAGPYLVKKDMTVKKVWVVVFTCLVTRFSYFVPVCDLTVTTFMRAFKELCSRHSTPLVVVSDNATNLTAASKILNMIMEKIKKDETNKLNIDWRFIPVKAPWFGGIYERIIGLMKRELKKLTNGTSFTYSEFCDHLLEVEKILNDRPLQAVGDSEVITPSVLVYGKKLDDHTNFSTYHIDSILQDTKALRNNLPKIYRVNQRKREKFWTAFQAEYLDMLKFKRGVNESGCGGRIPEVGDIVMVHDYDVRVKPRRALILEVLNSEDGLVRKCRVRIGKHESIRPLTSFRDLELNVKDSCPDYFVDSRLERCKTAVQDIDPCDSVEQSVAPLNASRTSRSSKQKAISKISSLYKQDLV